VASRPVLALDVGGTKLTAAVVDPNGRILESVRRETPRGPLVDADTLWRTVLAVLEPLRRDKGPRDLAGVGVGCGGPMIWPAGEVTPLSIPAWQGFPLRKLLQEELPGIPVRLHNDAICTAAGEHWRGAGRSADNVLGMVVASGVGGGLILGGRLIDGGSGNAGHVGHIVVDPNGPDCACGGNGCLEAIASGPRLASWAVSQGWRSTKGLTARDLAMDASRGHPVARAAMDRAGVALGRAIASATHLCDLEVVAVGGGLSQAGPLIFDPLEETFRRHVRLSFAREVRVVPVELGQESGLIGAAALVLRGDRYWSAD
jgi:glucokinase